MGRLSDYREGAAIQGMSCTLEAGKGKKIDFLPESPEKNTALLTLGFYCTESCVGFLTYKLSDFRFVLSV